MQAGIKQDARSIREAAQGGAKVGQVSQCSGDRAPRARLPPKLAIYVHWAFRRRLRARGAVPGRKPTSQGSPARAPRCSFAPSVPSDRIFTPPSTLFGPKSAQASQCHLSSPRQAGLQTSPCWAWACLERWQRRQCRPRCLCSCLRRSARGWRLSGSLTTTRPESRRSRCAEAL